MTLLEKHREDYTTLKKKELFKIIEEQLTLNRKRIDNNVYSYVVSKRNNNRRAVRRWLKQRNISVVARAKVKEKIAILRTLQTQL